MSLLTGSSSHTWQPVMTSETSTPSYWLNWRFFLCALWIFSSMVVASFLIWKCEGFKRQRTDRRENRQESAGFLYEDEAWGTCLEGIHPAWLLAYRIVALTVLLALLSANVIADGAGIFYFYTQWTFALVTFYFGLGTLFSIYGCCKQCGGVDDNTIENANLDAERGSYVAPTYGDRAEVSIVSKSFNSHGYPRAREAAGLWGYIFQIVFQMCAGAVLLTDCVFWLILYPFLMSKDYDLNFFIVTMHSCNALFLLGDTILNGLRFPLFRVAYFVLWTGIFVVFQWIIHACVSMWWPYPFLDLSSPYAPLWYVAVGLMHIPTYGVFALIIRVKRSLLSKAFPESFPAFR